jgi:hypothetical protein
MYWALRLDSSFSSLLANTYNTPFYFWPYVILTLGTILLFGINSSLFVYRSRKFGPPKLTISGGAGIGSLMSIFSSACPVCGSTLLSFIGLSGGLAILPFAGLELKAASFGLMLLSLLFIRSDLKKLALGCENGTCPLPRDPTYKESDGQYLMALIMVLIILFGLSWNMLQTEPILASTRALAQSSSNTNVGNGTAHNNQTNQLFDEIIKKVIPEEGFQSKIFLGESVLKLVKYGVIDREKFLRLYRDRGGLPKELSTVLDQPTFEPIRLTRENANYYINLLWPLGLANYMGTNSRSPINGSSLFDFASTGGWSLGKEENS